MATPAKRKLLTTKKRIAASVAGFTAAAVVGAASVAGAAPVDKPTKAWCNAHGFKNYGQCVKEWAQGHGYGGTTTNNVTTNVSVNVRGNHNVVDVVLNYFF